MIALPKFQTVGSFRGQLTPAYRFGVSRGTMRLTLTGLGRLVAVETELRVALLGEWTAGEAGGKSDAPMLALGTDIACAVISGGQPLRSANYRAATLPGHHTIAQEGPAGRGGNIGCAEALSATAALSTWARVRFEFASSHLARAERIGYEANFMLAAQGDARSQALLHQSLEVWPVVVQNAAIACDPEVVVLGGGGLRSGEIILPTMARHPRQHMPGLPLQILIVAAVLGDDAALLGGETLFRQIHPLSCP